MNLQSTYLARCLALSIVLLTCGIAWAQNEGQAKLDEATDLKLGANSPPQLQKVIDLCQDALEEGLDEDNTLLAKRLLSSTALQRAKMFVQQLPRIANNPQALRGFRRQTLRDLEIAVENDESLAEAHFLIAKIQTLPGGSLEKAMASADKALELYKDDPTELSQVYSLRAAMQEDNDDKIEDLTQAIDQDPANMQAWQALIALNIAVGKLDEAVQVAKDLLINDPENEFAIRAATESLMQLEKSDEAIKLLSERIEEDSDNGNLYRQRGRAHDLVGDDDKAVEDLTKAIELNGQDAEALLLRGSVYFDLGETEKANKDISESMLIEPNSMQGILMRSLVAAREDRYRDAISDMELLVRAAPGNTGFVMQLASYYQLDDRPRRAIKLLDELVRRGPQENERDLKWGVLRLRGDAKLAISEHKSAIADYEQAIKLLEKERTDAEDSSNTDGDYSGLLNNLAWVKATSPDEELRDGETAVEMGLKACEVTNYKAAHILSTLAAGYAETGDFENARKWAAKAVEVGEKDNNPQLEQLKEELESYKEDKPWREEQKTEENDAPISSANQTIDT